MKNILNIEISRPNQQLFIMRGIPGSGKTTMAKAIRENGVIHSTDDVIESIGDYRQFFETMVKSNDFSNLSRAHSTNLKNAIQSMKDGISPIIIDNTNIKATEPKAYVIAALEMGFNQNNIQICDVGISGLDAEVLASRNTHGVPLEKIKQMMKSHKSVGPLTINKILEAKDMYKNSDILYSAVVLDKASIGKLFTPINYNMDPPDGWVMGKHVNGVTYHFCDHMTICLGPLKDKSEIGKVVTLTVTHVGVSDMAMAFKVEGYPSKNDVPHITLAVNPDGGKPKDSNLIKNWVPIKNFTVNGVVTEVSKSDRNYDSK